MNNQIPPIEETILQCSVPNRHLIFLPKIGYYFAGSFRFQCLFGEVTVAGYTMKSTSFDEKAFVQFTVHNKAQIPLNFIPTINGNEENSADLLFQRVRYIMEGSANDFKRFSHYPAAILVDVAPSVVESYLTSRIGEFHKPLDRFVQHLVAGDCYIILGVRQDLGKIEPLGLHISDSATVHGSIGYALDKGNSLMITGNKDVGKSTMARYILNYLMSKTNSTVYLMDTDIGQTEFTPAGCVSLFRVDSPILTPTFLHQKKTFPNTYCIGSLSPGNQDYPLYQQCIRKLATEFENITDTKKFLLVNTHGWVEGFGLDIMRNLVSIIKPTTMLNMVAPNIPNLDIPTMMFGQHYFQYQVMPRINASTCREVNARTWRDFALTGYFANCLGDERFGKPSPDRTLTNVMSYEVFFDKIGLYFHPDRPPVTDNLILNSLNCSIIALCGFAPEVDKETSLRKRKICNDSRWPTIFSNVNPAVKPVLRCYGFGFIRGISLEKRNFYIISPVMLDDFSKVEVLFIPHNISAPFFMFDREVSGFSGMQIQRPTWSNSETRRNVRPQSRAAANAYNFYPQSSRIRPPFAAPFAQTHRGSPQMQFRPRNQDTTRGSRPNQPKSTGYTNQWRS